MDTHNFYHWFFRMVFIFTHISHLSILSKLKINSPTDIVGLFCILNLFSSDSMFKFILKTKLQDP